MSVNINSTCMKYLERHMNEKKLNNLVYDLCHQNRHIISAGDFEEELIYTYRHSLRSTRGNLYEHVIRHYVSKDKRFDVVDNKSKYTLELKVASAVSDRVNEIICGIRSKSIDIRDVSTYNNILEELHELVINTPKTSLVRYKTQIDLLFIDKNDKSVYYYELKTLDNNSNKSDLETLRSFLMIYCHLISEYKIIDINKINVGIVYSLEDSSFTAKSYPMCSNGAMSFKEFCERFYTIDVAESIIEEVHKCMNTYLDDNKPYFKKVNKVYHSSFKGKEFTKRQLISAVDSYSYKS